MVLYPAGPFRSHGHTFRTSLGEAFLLFPRHVKTFFENSSLTREKREAALLTCRGWLYTMLHKCTRAHSCTHTTNLGACSEPLTGSVHTQTFPPSPSHCCAPAMGTVSLRLLQGASLSLCLGPYALAGTQGHGSRQDDSTDLPKLPQC